MEGAIVGKEAQVRGSGVLTPYTIDATFVFLESCVWQSTPFPKMMRIMTPKNSAAGSRRYSLETMTHW